MSNKIVTDVIQPGRRRVVIDVPTASAQVEFEARVNGAGLYDVTCIYWCGNSAITVKEMEGGNLQREEVKARWERLKKFYGIIAG